MLKYLAFLPALLILILAYKGFSATLWLKHHGMIAPGRIIANVHVPSNKGPGTEHPRVQFRTHNGRVVTFTSPQGSSSPSFEPGEKVTVLYDPADVSNAQIDTFGESWSATLIIGIMGLIFTAAGALVVFGKPTRSISSKAANY